jgi:GNAT superfamily N-acetyltransferase
MLIRQLDISDVGPDLFACFNRYYEDTQCWRKDENRWVLEDAKYIRDWDSNKKKWALEYYTRGIDQGDIVIGVFDENKLIGIARIDKELRGSQSQYVNLSIIILSYGYRNKGTGRRLFAVICEKAISLNAKKLYVSAEPAKGPIAFYQKMGFVDAKEIIQEFVDSPLDRPMEYELYHCYK